MKFLDLFFFVLIGFAGCSTMQARTYRHPSAKAKLLPKNNDNSALGTCDKPTGAYQILFSMVEDPKTTASAMQSFLQNHKLNSDTFDGDCKTALFKAVDQKRIDIFKLLYDNLLPDPNKEIAAPDGHYYGNSLYDYVLENGDVITLQALRSLAKAHHQTLNLQALWIFELGWTQKVTPLMAASLNPDVAMVNQFLEEGAAVDAEAEMGVRAVTLAALNKNSEIMEALVVKKGAKVNYNCDKTSTPIQKAAELNPNADVIKILLKAGADVGKCNPDILVTASSNNSADVFQALLDAGANVHYDENQTNPYDDSLGSPLYAAATFYNYNPKIIQLLINAGAQVNDYSPYFQSTPFLSACGVSSAEVIMVLLNAGGNVGSGNPLMSVMGNRYLNIHPGALGVTLALLNHKADFNFVDENGISVLMSASKDAGTVQEQPDIVKTLIKAGAKVKAADKNGQTPLHYAATRDNPQTLQALIDVGADVNAVGNDGETPLMIAAYGGLMTDNPGWSQTVTEKLIQDSIRVLLKAGADLNAKDKSGKTALDYAKTFKNIVPASRLKLLGQ